VGIAPTVPLQYVEWRPRSRRSLINRLICRRSGGPGEEDRRGGGPEEEERREEHEDLREDEEQARPPPQQDRQGRGHPGEADSQVVSRLSDRTF
jgi:hypothetical protein